MQNVILAVASKGGHWEQLMLLRPAFEGAIVHYACTDPNQIINVQPEAFVSIKDYSRSEPLEVFRGVFEIYSLIRRVRPTAVISTGAAPGLLALVIGRFFGAKSIWIDSIANSQKMSLSGRVACFLCKTTITQWEHLARKSPAHYWGSVL